MEIIFYTDGSSHGNPGPGGWGIYIEVIKKEKKEIFTTRINGGEKLTTNNRMELKANIEALKYLKKNLNKILKNILQNTKEKEERELKIKIKTDSQYVKNGITIWIKTWEKNNWKNSNKKEVINKDLWQELLNLKNYINKKLIENNFKEIEFEYVKAHIGILGNEIADSLANEASNNMKSN